MGIIKKIFIILLLLFLFSLLTRNLFHYRSKIDFYNQYKTQLNKEKKRALTLQTEILKKSDRFQIEKSARDKLNLLYQDEVAIILPPPSLTPFTPTPSPAPNWQQWWQLFFTSR